MRVRSGVVLGTLVIGLAAFPAQAWATAPTNANLQFRTGSLSTGSSPVTVPLTLKWTAGSSDLGYSCCTYQVNEDDGIGTFHATTQGTSVNLRLPLEDGNTGAGGCCYGFSVTGFDGGGNDIGFTQNPYHSQTPAGFQETNASYTGAWVSTSETQYWGGASSTTMAGGASATISDECGESVAWVTTTGPTHGSAKVYVNGVYDRTVSTYASVIHYRQVVWFKHVGGDNSCPVIKIVGLATANHPKVSVDGFIAINDD